MIRSLVVVTSLFLAVSAGNPTPVSAEGGFEAWYALRARIRSPRVDADLEAGGRLAMTAQRDSSGALHLQLESVPEAPWKLFWVDPLGPLGDEVKVATVVTLPEASWEALAEARARAVAHGHERHRLWLENADKPRQLDGTFAFIVIGAPNARFTVSVDPGGAIAEVSNRMTQHWLPGPFDQFLGTWDRVRKTETLLSGYWFWNDGEGEPPDYEPHTYHAFEAALELLELPLPSLPAGAREAIRWPELANRTARVLAILAPKAGAGGPSTHSAEEVELEIAKTCLGDGSCELEVTTEDPTFTPGAARETMFSSRGWPVRDRMRVRLDSKRGGFLEIEVGYGPEGSE